VTTRAKQTDWKTSKADIAAIKQTTVDYVEGWFEGNADRMESCLHPNLAKREVVVHAKTGRNALGLLSATMMTEMTRAGGGKEMPTEKRQKEVIILDVWQDMASVKVMWPTFIDYLHLAKFNGEWVIVNVLWEKKLNPKQD
jgi:hypothetical protein